MTNIMSHLLHATVLHNGVMCDQSFVSLHSACRIINSKWMTDFLVFLFVNLLFLFIRK